MLVAAGPALLVSRRAMPGDASWEDLAQAGKGKLQHGVASTAAIDTLSATSHCTT